MGKGVARVVDGRAERGEAGEGAWRREEYAGNPARRLVVADHHPIGDDFLRLGARPFDEGDGDRAVRTGLDRLDDARVGHRRGVALALQAKLVLIDAARDVGGENELEIDSFGSRRGRKPEQGDRDQHTEESLPHHRLREGSGSSITRSRRRGEAMNFGGRAADDYRFDSLAPRREGDAGEDRQRTGVATAWISQLDKAESSS